jgi:hypothetical protein
VMVLVVTGITSIIFLAPVDPLILDIRTAGGHGYNTRQNRRTGS